MEETYVHDPILKADLESAILGDALLSDIELPYNLERVVSPACQDIGIPW